MTKKQKSLDNGEILFGRCDFIINNPEECKDCEDYRDYKDGKCHRYDTADIKSLEK